MTDEDVEQEIEELLGELSEYDDLEAMLEDLDGDDEFDEEESLDAVFDDAGD